MANKPCPFCGSREEEFGKHPETCFLFRLMRQQNSYCMAYTYEECIWAWNKRFIKKRSLKGNER
jgi:hypothetical protein